MGNLFNRELLKLNTKILIPQLVPNGFYHSYFTFAATFEGSNYGIKWQEFRKKFMENGGDGIYAAWKILPDEGPFKRAMRYGLYSGYRKISDSYGYGETPVARMLQKKIMQFTTNQENKKQMLKQIYALKKTIDYFKI